MPEVARTMKDNQLLCGRGIPCKDERFEREVSLKPCLANYVTFPKFMHEMHEDMCCIHRILKLIHL